MRRILAALSLILLAAAISAPQAAETRRYFGDWLGACRNDGYCSAVGYLNPNPGDGRVADYWFRIGRHAQETWWELSFTPIVVMADPTASMTLVVDDAAETFLGPEQLGPYGAINDFFFMGSGAQAVLDRMMPGNRLDVRFTDADGAPRLASFSLQGLTAALIWIDETQGRLGSERVAEAPPVGLPPANQPPVALPSGELTLADLPPDLIAEDSARPDACDGFDIVGQWPFYAYPLGEGQTLYLFPCTGGAYNRFYSVYLGDGAGYQRLDFATPTYSAGWQAEPGIWLEGFDPQTLELRSANLGRGMGDCGMRGRWQWSGSRFVMLDYTLQAACDASVEPGQFPLVYRNPALDLPD
jgi:hypothetical protein